jgi:hypothetical protein
MRKERDRLKKEFFARMAEWIYAVHEPDGEERAQAYKYDADQLITMLEDDQLEEIVEETERWTHRNYQGAEYEKEIAVIRNKAEMAEMAMHLFNEKLIELQFIRENRPGVDVVDYFGEGRVNGLYLWYSDPVRDQP